MLQWLVHVMRHRDETRFTCSSGCGRLVTCKNYCPGRESSWIAPEPGFWHDLRHLRKNLVLIESLLWIFRHVRTDQNTEYILAFFQGILFIGFSNCSLKHRLGDSFWRSWKSLESHFFLGWKSTQKICQRSRKGSSECSVEYNPCFRV